MPQNKILIGTLVVIGLMILMMSVFTVKQTEVALKLRLGSIVDADFKPGLHFKLPLIDTIRTFDSRIQSFDATPEHFLTQEKKNLIVDSYIKWKISDVTTFFTTVAGNPQRAGQRLAEIIADGLRSEFGKRTIQEVVSGSRAQIMVDFTKEASKRANQFGIEVIDIRIKRIELPKEVSVSVYRRMDAERERVAKELRSRGEAAAVRIQAEADRERIEMVAKAERDAEQIRGEGDATAANIYAKAYTKNPEFYTLYRSLNAYKTTFNSKNDILLIQPDSDFFSYFSQPQGKPKN